MNRNDEQFMAQKIRAQYMEKDTSELDALRELDARVKRPANVFAYVFGSVSAIIMGTGMSLVMTDIGATVGIASALVPGIVIGIIVGVVGGVVASLAYPVYNATVKAKRKKLAPEIIRLADELMK
jgi:hypothetical protein